MIHLTRRTRMPAATALAATLALLLGACAPREDAPDPEATPPAATAPAPATAPPDARVPPDAVDTVDAGTETDASTMQRVCNADAVQGLVGQEATEAVVTKATADSNSASVRVLRPGDAATMDFRQDRMNINLDDAGMIEKIGCG
ncbi:I78 family peptidase inhibitor [Luteimonas kalidii]|uniref:I78 family peptidase inhibitor n=1 Tax=Luteimonas kalidii TaxID=3042025 RepID=A0ABT6JQ74_9GAMM|nr:I78 family peptidase inhibitor [Luteimonas kalidii]MDH5832772.1 I78 family peptidase inhibitor [Luteimonas kalidii]